MFRQKNNPFAVSRIDCLKFLSLLQNTKRGKRYVTENGSENNILTEAAIPTKKSYLRSKNVS